MCKYTTENNIKNNEKTVKSFVNKNTEVPIQITLIIR